MLYRAFHTNYDLTTTGKRINLDSSLRQPVYIPQKDVKFNTTCNFNLSVNVRRKKVKLIDTSCFTSVILVNSAFNLLKTLMV